MYKNLSNLESKIHLGLVRMINPIIHLLEVNNCILSLLFQDVHVCYIVQR